MKIKWLGHACFLITSGDGLKVITDPYVVGGGIKYGPVEETADVVLVSHEHGDHSNVSAVRGKPEVIRGSGARTVKGVQFRGIATHHDGSEGKQRGSNTVFCFTADDINVCHLGDLGHTLSKGQVDEIGSVDVLLAPIGGFYTIDAAEASRVCAQLKPRVVIPMHFRTARCDFPIADAEEFLRGKEAVRRIGGSEVEFQRADLPTATQIVLLQPAL